VIQSVDDTLFHLLANGLTTLGGPPPTAGQIRVQPPDRDWRWLVGRLSGLKALNVNVYLVDVRENRKLRSNEVLREYGPGQPSKVSDLGRSRKWAQSAVQVVGHR
jgi:hypothetical protein